jgi:excisionase family DNA binding protein
MDPAALGSAAGRETAAEVPAAPRPDAVSGSVGTSYADLRSFCVTSPGNRAPDRSNRDSAGGASDWLSIAEASAVLGVSGATLRRWSDDGRVPVFTTPGGHRRFSRRTLQHLLPATRRDRPPLARLGASPDRIVRAYRPRKSTPTSAPPWMEHLSDADRIEFRERGRRLLELLVEHLDAPDASVAALTLGEACRLAAGHGRQVAALGASMTEAVQTFLQFRTPFTAELASTARRRGLDTREATALLISAEAAMDQLLVATMTGHSLATGQRLAAQRMSNRS